MKITSSAVQILFFASVTLFTSCSKSDSAGNTPPTPNVCEGKTIIITATPTDAAGCSNDGSITASASGSTNFSYKLNSGGTYQASGTFTNLAAGAYTVFAKDGEGCEKTTSITVTSNTKTGSLFTTVKDLIANRCESCHNNAVQNGGRNWTVDCNIVAGKDRIKVRAVDEGTMPQGGPELTLAEKNIITNWINAGGRLTD